MTLCAICDGTNETTWICEKCKLSKYNRDWVGSVNEVVTDDEETFSTKAGPSWDADPGKFENALSIEVMRQYCLGVGNATEIAALVGITPRMARYIIEYWLDNYGYAVGEIKAALEE